MFFPLQFNQFSSIWVFTQTIHTTLLFLFLCYHCLKLFSLLVRVLQLYLSMQFSGRILCVCVCVCVVCVCVCVCVVCVCGFVFVYCVCVVLVSVHACRQLLYNNVWWCMIYRQRSLQDAGGHFWPKHQTLNNYNGDLFCGLRAASPFSTCSVALDTRMHCTYSINTTEKCAGIRHAMLDFWTHYNRAQWISFWNSKPNVLLLWINE